MARYLEGDYDGPRRSRFRCTFCGTREAPSVRRKTTGAGWVVFFLLLLFCFPVCFLGLFITEESRYCYDCGMRLG